MEETYKIRRRSMDGSLDEVVATDLTLEEAQAWCRDPETSSQTCTKPEMKLITRTHGMWFDGYEEE